MPTKKSKALTDERPLEITELAEESETVTEQAVLSKREVIAQVRANIRNRRVELDADGEALATLRADKAYQRDLLIQQRDEADDAHQSAIENEQEAAGRVTRENARLQYAKGTQAEG